MGKKNQRTVYEWVNILINQVYEWVYFFNDQVNDWGRFQKFGPHTRTQLPLSYPPPPIPRYNHSIHAYPCIHDSNHILAEAKYKLTLFKNATTKFHKFIKNRDLVTLDF